MRPNLATAQPGDFYTFPLRETPYATRPVAFLYVQRVVRRADRKVIEGKLCEVHTEGMSLGSFEEVHTPDCQGDCHKVEDCWVMSCGSHETHPTGYLCDCPKRCIDCGMLECVCAPVYNEGDDRDPGPEDFE